MIDRIWFAKKQSARIVWAVCSAAVIVFMTGVVTYQAKAQDQDVADLVTKTLEGSAKGDSPLAASHEVQRNLTEQLVKDQVTDLIGEKRYLKNKAVIDSKINRQAAKFIPFVNVSTPVAQADGTYKTSIEFRFSPASLRKMVLDAGLLNDSEGPASILPLIAFIDHRAQKSSSEIMSTAGGGDSQGNSLRWWLGEEKDQGHRFLSEVEESFFDKLQREFAAQGFHMIRPLATETSPLPEPYRVPRPGSGEAVFIAEYFQASMVIKGEVAFGGDSNAGGAGAGSSVGGTSGPTASATGESVPCSIRLQVIQPMSGRVIAEVSRQFDTDSGGFESGAHSKFNNEAVEIGKDMAAQVFEAWQRGTLNANLVRLAVHGKLTPKQLVDFKNELTHAVHEVKGIKERLFAPGEVIFEVDYAGTGTQLADRIKGVKLAAVSVVVGDSSEKQVSIDVKPSSL